MPRTPLGLIFVLVVAMSSTSQAQNAAQLISQASASYHGGAYAESAALYVAALEQGAANPAVAYNAACSYALAGQPEPAFRYLERAVDGGYRDVDNMVVDADLASLHDDPRWSDMVDKIRAAHDAFRAGLAKPDLRDELLSMARADQETRSRSGGDPSTVEEIARLDEAHTARLKAIVDRHGWPGKSLVGEDGARAAWLLVQHADRDPAFQERCLALMEKAAARGEVSKTELAFLTDRVRVAQGRKQVYGTQFTFVDGEMMPQPIADEATVDQRRRALGLPSLAEYKQQLEALNQHHHGHGGDHQH